MLKYSLYESTYFFRKEPIFLCSSQPIIECRSNTLKWEPSANYNMFDHFWWNKKVLPWNCPSSFHNIFCHVFLKAKCSRNNMFIILSYTKFKLHFMYKYKYCLPQILHNWEMFPLKWCYHLHFYLIINQIMADIYISKEHLLSMIACLKQI